MEKTKKFSRRQVLKGISSAGALALTGTLFTSKSFSAEPPIKISAPHPLTGPAAAFGKHSHWGLLVAQQRINEGGGIAGRKVELLVEDDAGKPADAVRIMKKHILQDKADFIVGGCSSAETIPMVPVAAELETVFMVTVAEAAEITDKICNKYTFRLTPDARQKAVAAVPYMTAELKTKKWQMLYWDMAWGESLRDEFRAQLKKKGGDLVGAIPIPLGTTDFAQYLTKLKPLEEAPGVIHAVAGMDSIRLDKAIGEFGLQKKYTWMGTCCAMFPEVFQELWPAVNGMYVIDQYPDLPIAPLDTQWDKKFREEFVKVSNGIPPESHSWSSFESLFILKKAIEKAGYRNKKDTSKVIKAVEGQKGEKDADFPQGPYYMRPEDHQGFTNLYLFQIKDGKEVMKEIIPYEKTMFPPSPECKM